MLRLFFSDTVEAHALLREAVRLAWGWEGLPRLEREAWGKPRFPARPDHHFNLSHSGPYALCALGDMPVGADVERVRPRRSFLPRKALSPEEFDWFQARGGRWEDFYTLWTLKEARVKCQGSGLDRPPREIAVPLLSPGGIGTLGGLTFAAYTGPGWRAALCSPGGAALLEDFPLS